MPYDRLIFRVHAIVRMFERDISDTDVRDVLENGQIIEECPDDLPNVSRLLLGWCGGRPIHVLVSDDPQTETTVIVTAYEPDRALWSADFTRRR